jgi:hypothetical protein
MTFRWHENNKKSPDATSGERKEGVPFVLEQITPVSNCDSDKTSATPKSAIFKTPVVVIIKFEG